MALTLHQASVPVFVQLLTGVCNVIDKLEAQAAEKKIDSALFLGERLYPNMFAYGRQIQAMCDWANNTCAWLAGRETLKFPNAEQSLADWKSRVQKSIEFIQAIPADDINAGETREITYSAAGAQRRMRGDDFLLHQALPQFYFHVTTAYNILRSRGVDLGKRDYMGPIPRMVQF